jgi:deoxyribose-phosphate aldolase
LAKFIDHTALKADTKTETVERYCREAVQYGFASVCINPVHVKYAAGLLKGTGVSVCTVVGFPLGANTPAVKAFETREAVENGADEVDMVINVGALKDGNLDEVEKDIRAVVEAAAGKALVKVIIETCLLTDEEKITACRLAQRSGAGYVKTSTGFSGGATAADVALMRKTVGDGMGVKASAGIRSRDDALAMLRAGASRLGTSAGMSIIGET